MTSTQQKIEVLMNIGAESLVEQTLCKLLEMQIVRYQAAIHDITAELTPFERTFQMSSAEGYRRFQAGELGDSGDLVEWVSLYENILLYQQRLRMLSATLS